MIYNTIRKRTFEIIEKGENDDKPSQVFDVLLSVLIVLNIVSVFIETFNISETYRNWLSKFEFISIIIFSIEYVCRIWTADFLYKGENRIKARIKYIFSFMALVDLFSILPFYIPFVLIIDLRILRVLRLSRILRIVKLNRYTVSLQRILNVIKDKSYELISAVFLLGILMLVSSILIYYIESPYQPEIYKNALSGLWWSLAVFTSVWLGDVYPITVLGRVFCGITAVLGVAIIAVPTGIITSGFSQDNEDIQANVKANQEQLELLNELKTEIAELKKTQEKILNKGI